MSNNLKLKEQYRDSYKKERYGWLRTLSIQYGLATYESTFYPNMRSKCHKKFSTRSELSMNTLAHKELHKDYHQYGLKIRAKRLGAIPNPWDDLPTDVWSMKSWKDRSKRKKQYKSI